MTLRQHLSAAKDRLVAAGKLDQHRVRDEWERWKGIARFFGYFFFGLGLVLLVGAGLTIHRSLPLVRAGDVPLCHTHATEAEAHWARRASAARAASTSTAQTVGPLS